MSELAQINAKRHYFSGGTISLPFSHPYLHEIVEFKRDKKPKNESFFQEEKHKLIQMENFEKSTRIWLSRSLLQLKSTFYHLNSTFYLYFNFQKNREDEIKKWFDYTKVEFHYPDDIDDFYLLIEKFQKDTFNDDEQNKETADKGSCNIFGVKRNLTTLLL